MKSITFFADRIGYRNE